MINLCKNCGNKNVGNYCYNCGQIFDIKEITFQSIIEEILASFNLEKGFFFTLKELLISPNKVIEGYIGGKRTLYYNPIKFFLFFYSTVSLGQAVLQINNNVSGIRIFFENLIFFSLLSIIFYIIRLNKLNYINAVVIALYTGSLLFVLFASFSTFSRILVQYQVITKPIIFIVLLLIHLLLMTIYLNRIYKLIFKFRNLKSIIMSIITLILIISTFGILNNVNIYSPF